jgi:ATP-dependent 26S proteasome regulatory subunit
MIFSAQEYFPSTIEHLCAEMARIEALVRSQINRMRHADGSQEFKGLVITEQEIDTLLNQPLDEAWNTSEGSALPAATSSILSDLSASIEKKSAESLLRGVQLYLLRLAEIIDLTNLDKDIVLIALAPELDLRFERLYAYLQDDVTKKRPSVDLVLSLLCSDMRSKIAARERFSLDAPLMKYRLIHLFNDPSQHMPPLLSRYIKMDDSIVDYLLGRGDMDTQLRPFVHCRTPRMTWDVLLFHEDFKERLIKLFKNIKESGDRALVYFQGRAGVGKKSTAEALCREFGFELLVVNIERLSDTPQSAADSAVRLIIREAQLKNSAVYWEGADVLTDEGKLWWQDILGQVLNDGPQLTFISGEKQFEHFERLNRYSAIQIVFPIPGFQERRRMWEAKLKTGKRNVAQDVEISTIATKFRLTGGQIEAAAATAANIARWRCPENGTIGRSDLLQACRVKSNQKLSTLAKKIRPHYNWDDIVLPSDRLAQLKEICSTVKHSAIVYETWGFDRKLAMGKGVNILFAGPSGTGKTMAADIMANVLGLDLYKIDISGVVSKYIGETEKNMARIFSEAETSNAILFFDEADALFGKRTEVRDSHDRFANIEISYLLQRMEEYEGVVILATNLQKNMDDAFVRRMHFTIEFPLPGKKERVRIWESIWPKEIPRSNDLDLAFMAKQFDVAGGNIRNIALAAAFYAADDGHSVDMNHLMRATLREYQKMGKIVVDREFGQYAGLKGGERKKGGIP